MFLDFCNTLRKISGIQAVYLHYENAASPTPARKRPLAAVAERIALTERPRPDGFQHQPDTEPGADRLEQHRDERELFQHPPVPLRRILAAAQVDAGKHGKRAKLRLHLPANQQLLEERLLQQPAVQQTAGKSSRLLSPRRLQRPPKRFRTLRSKLPERRS